jgi:ABC-2 type transport system ATP-binding protein
VVRNDKELVLKSSGDVFTEALFARFGNRIRRLAVEEPSLESVFLSLTGRELRDQAAGARELTYEFGKRGGEHTK